MRKPVQILGTTLGAAAIVGATSAVASAHDGYGGYDHHSSGGYDHHSFGDHYGSDHHSYGGGDYGSHDYGGYDHHSYGGYGDHSDDQDGDSQGDGYDHHSWSDGDQSSGPQSDSSTTDHSWWGSDHYAHHGDVGSYGGDRSAFGSTTSDHHGFGSPGDYAATFDQRKAAVVSALQAADARLTSLQDRLNSEAASDPSGYAPEGLTWVTQARAHVESLLSQVQAATTDQELAAALQQARSDWAPTS